MLRSVEENKKVKNFYELIKSDYRIIERICLICLNDTTNADNEIHFINDTNNNGDIIHDINLGRFKNFLDYIKPKNCPHFYHDKCLKNSQQIKKELAYNCPFCRLFMTSKNLKNFGCFISKIFFTDFFLILKMILKIIYGIILTLKKENFMNLRLKSEKNFLMN